MSRPPSSRQTTTNNALVRPRLSDLNQLVSAKPGALQLKVQWSRARGSEYVFPADHTIKRPMSENAVLYLLHRMGYKGKMTGHGWRSVASTWANEASWNADAIEKQLAHLPDDKVRAAYNKAAHLDLRCELMQAWADWLVSCGLKVDACGT